MRGTPLLLAVSPLAEFGGVVLPLLSWRTGLGCLLQQGWSAVPCRAAALGAVEEWLVLVAEKPGSTTAARSRF